MTLEYANFEAQGNRLRKWMESNDGPECPIRSSKLNIEDLRKSWKGLKLPPNGPKPTILDQRWHEWADSVGFPFNEENHRIYSEGILKSTVRPGMTKWIGRIGPGVIFIDNIRREKGSDDPYMSEFAESFYGMYFDIKSLKHVIFASVIEKDTYKFVTNHLFAGGIPGILDEWQSWESPSSEFCGLLGTPIGKVAGSLIVGAYGRGGQADSPSCRFLY